MKRKTKTQKGFTLIELLMVIAIIGILSSIVLVNLNGARSRALDAVRASDLKQLQTAAEAYHAEYGSYPVNPNPDWQGTCPYYGSVTQWIPGISEYFSNLPQDPNYDCASYRTYIYASNGVYYDILDYNGPTYPSSNPSLIDCRYSDSWSVGNMREEDPAYCLNN